MEKTVTGRFVVGPWPVQIKRPRRINADVVLTGLRLGQYQAIHGYRDVQASNIVAELIWQAEQSK